MRLWRSRYEKNRRRLIRGIEASVDADIQHVRENRLSAEERSNVAIAVFDGEGFEDDRYLGCFEVGYSWGRQKEITWLFPTAAAQAEIDAALSYERVGGDVASLAERGGSAAVAHAFYATLPELGKRMAVADDRPGFATADEAFKAAYPRLSAEEDLQEHVARSVFHAGSAFAAFEAEFLLRRLMKDRVRNAQRRIKK